MAASSDDKFMYVGKSTATTLSSPGYTVGNTSINVASTTNWPTASGVMFAIDETDADGARVSGTYNVFRGTVASGTQIDNLVYVGGDTNRNYSAGATTRVYILVSADRDNRLIDGILLEHNKDGTHGAITSTGATLTTPKVITSINDTNDNELVKVTATASAVNELTVTNAATGNAPSISATGGDTNINLELTPKGTGTLTVGGNTVMTGAWADYTPTLTNVTTGNGTLVAKYTQIGKTVICQGSFTLGSTSSISGVVTVTLPVTALNTNSNINLGTGHLLDFGTNLIPVMINQLDGTTFDMRAVTTFSGTNPVFTAINSSYRVSNSTPFTFTTNDFFSWNIMYEAA